MTREPLSYRDRRLVLAVMGSVLDAEGPVAELEIADVFVSRPWSTVSRILRELVGCGAVRVVKGPGGRSYEPTPLGRAWIAREVAPWPWPGTDPLESGEG